MKKIICGALALMSVFCLAGCGEERENGGLELSYNKKYVYRADLHQDEAEQEYYIFYKDGTAKYHYYSNLGEIGIESYTIRFKYEIVEEENMVFCFYNGFEYDDADTYQDSPSNTSVHKLMYTENFLMDTGSAVYMTEDFAETIPNFGKRE